ncbi:MAG: ABC transporter ATP-binding protein, partial [Proteobacteria bacterium]|nr:ABC transporter ATP-binding protein [Pseudomonadota bacterium]
SILVIISLVSVGRFILHFSVNFYTSCCQQLCLLNLRRMLFNRVFSSSAEDAIAPSQVQFLLGSVSPRAANFLFQFVTIISCLFQVLGLLALMVRTSWLLTISAATLIGFTGLLVVQISRQIRIISSEVPAKDAQIYARLHMALRNWMFVKIMRFESNEMNELSRLAGEQYLDYRRYAIFKNLNYGISSLAGVLIVVGIVFIGHYFWKIPADHLVAFLYLTFRFVGLMSNVVGTLDTMAVESSFFGIATKEIGRSRPQEVSREHIAPRLSASGVARAPSIAIHGISFRYMDTSEDAIANMSLVVSAGQQLGIMGPSGSGKSTLLSLILGIYKPYEGDVKICGITANDFLRENRDLIGYVGPDPFIIAGSIRSNLLYGSARADITDFDIWLALEKSSLKAFVNGLAKGLDYSLSEAGDGLSVGQKQRLSLARALLRLPTLLVLDECTANLDDQTESELALSLNSLKGQVTMIIVSHKRGILKFADQIVDISTMKQI